jgi:hypothetical protein
MHDLFRYYSFSPSWLTCRHHQGAIWSPRARARALRTLERQNRRGKLRASPQGS